VSGAFGNRRIHVVVESGTDDPGEWRGAVGRPYVSGQWLGDFLMGASLGGVEYFPSLRFVVYPDLRSSQLTTLMTYSMVMLVHVVF